MNWHHVLCLNCQGRFQRLASDAVLVGDTTTSRCPLCNTLTPIVVTSPPRPSELCESCGSAHHPSDMHWIYEAYLARSHSRA